ncbi:hypothetical protein C461_04247 [Halorubrum aidingense JCM 13560]|uniref:Uncharacterized protein n=1 Tax=Halorubrum aidingense JCM 13560 TaxID=1230454 RepID=M0PJ74_9EURY|nr:hypothetical protein [Halorubrum aidingense]EMA68810.1 hypothetical protein C461_04247 [Halorubrum aidingense JCM 13560]
MRPELKERRERTWWLLNGLNQRYSDVVKHISQEFDCSESTVKRDISKMGDWLDDLDGDLANRTTSLLRHLQRTRTRRWEMVQAARSVDEKELERRLLNDVDDNVERSLALREDLDKLTQSDSTHHQFEVSDQLSDQEFVTLERMTHSAPPENAVGAGKAQAGRID